MYATLREHWDEIGIYVINWGTVWNVMRGCSHSILVFLVFASRGELNLSCDVVGRHGIG